MKFLSAKVELKTIWEPTSTAQHSVGSIRYLGIDKQGWDILRFHPKYDNGQLLKAFRSIRADMNSPDEDTGAKKNQFIYTPEPSGLYFEIHIKDVENLLRRLQLNNFITEDDFKLIHREINENKTALIAEKTNTPSLSTEGSQAAYLKSSYVY